MRSPCPLCPPTPRASGAARTLGLLVALGGSVALTALRPAPATAQGARGRWEEIGRTVAGNPVFVDRRSVRREQDVVTATLRVRFAKPVASPRGPITSARTLATFDCARRLVAIRENVYFHDEDADRVYERKVVGAPGYGPPMGGSMPEVAIAHLCPADARK
jgi:hypothetical protein